jgi:hypothetical protein
LVPDPGLAPLHLAGKEPRQIEHVQTEHHHILPASAGAHLAHRVNLQHVADESLPQGGLQAQHDGRATRHMGDRDPPRPGLG